MDMMQDEDFASVLRALGHPVRLNILRILAERQQSNCCCTDVMQCLPLAQSTVSQHIKVLLDAGLIDRHPKGTRNCYSLRNDRLASLEQAFGGLFAGLVAEPRAGRPEPVAEPV
jgi:ArsR family transcriptional regulator